jgi:serine/threonine-protein kinase
VDFRSDIFSLGTVLYEMVCGRNPYAHNATAEVISAIMGRLPEPLRQVAGDCPRDLERIVDRCAQKDRNDRYQSASELLIDLDNFQKGIALPHPPKSFLDVRFAALAAAVLLLIVVGISAYRSWAGSEQILAIWPIECEGADLQTKCPGPAITDNLARVLQRRHGLRVVLPRAVPTLYGPAAASPQRAGRDVNADTIFSGRISRGEHGLVLTTRLHRVNDGSRIAEDSYQLNLDKLSQLEQRVSLETAYYLQLPMNDDDRSLFGAMAAQQNRSPEALTLYLSGRTFWSKRDGQNIKKAIENFQQATEKDPLFALAWAGLADCYVLMNSPAYGEMASKDAMVRAEFAAKQALKIDENLAEAHNAYASVLMRGHWDWENAEKEFKRAISLNPDYSPARLGYSSLLSHTGRQIEALTESELGKNLDPFSPAAIMNHCRTQYYARQFDQASACLQQLAVENPKYAGGKYLRGIVDIELGRLPEATQIYEEIYAGDKLYGGAMLGFCYGLANRRNDAERILDEMRELQKSRYVPAQELGIIYLGLNEMDLATPLLRKSVEEKFAPSQALFAAPLFDRYRSDPRFNELAKLVKQPSRPSPASASPSTSTR